MLPDYRMTNFAETQALLEPSSFFYIITTNMAGRYSYINTNYARTFAQIYGSLLGQPYDITMHPEDTKVCAEVAARCFANPERLFPATIRKHDGRGGFLITQWEYKAILNAQQQPEGIFCIGYDITEYMDQKEQLEGTRELLNLKENVLKEIGWYQSHVIRKPLANIMGLVKILEKMDLDQNMKNICQMLITSSLELDAVLKNTANRHQQP
ncbi:PAS domain-containing protein [Pontibacter beigongshangensis]|uniref:PAS domain-containing protein n=1 Tax=Pontibacter beigongshangensis TaxID=2574733 RepID=UPI001650764F|nr:PAS domain-containing protein [Pontibacter beigongshangensis]